MSKKSKIIQYIDQFEIIDRIHFFNKMLSKKELNKLYKAEIALLEFEKKQYEE